MAVASATFRDHYPEFVDLGLYPDETFSFWLTVAGLLLNADRWDDLLDIATELFIAHHLVIGARDQTANSAGGLPGQVQGVLTAKAVDKVSASYDASYVAIENGDFWNTTLYGIRFLRLARMIGAGGIQL